MHRHIIELALEALEAKRAEVELELEAIRKLMTGRTAVTTAVPHEGRRRKRTAAERRAQSLKMKQIWAAKRAARKIGKAPSKPKSGPQSAAAREAVSRRMKAYWKKRKAGARK